MNTVAIPVTLAGVGLSAVAREMATGSPAQIVQIAIGTGGALLDNKPVGYTPSGAETGLRAEVARISIAAASQVSDREWMVEAAFDPLPANAAPIVITEAAAFLSDGTLFGIWSRPNGALFMRMDTTSPLIGLTIALTELPLNAVQFVTVGEPSSALLWISERFDRMLRDLLFHERHVKNAYDHIFSTIGLIRS